MNHLQTKDPIMPYDKWKQKLIEITAQYTGMSISEIKINDESASIWYHDGFTPYCTFRETY